MIKLEVKDYCENCPDFDVRVIKPFRRWRPGKEDEDDSYNREDTVVTCQNTEMCARLVNRIIPS